jgi:hypothetical protein
VGRPQPQSDRQLEAVRNEVSAAQLEVLFVQHHPHFLHLFRTFLVGIGQRLSSQGRGPGNIELAYQYSRPRHLGVQRSCIPLGLKPDAVPNSVSQGEMMSFQMRPPAVTAVLRVSSVRVDAAGLESHIAMPMM